MRIKYITLAVAAALAVAMASCKKDSGESSTSGTSTSSETPDSGPEVEAEYYEEVFDIEDTIDPNDEEAYAQYAASAHEDEGDEVETEYFEETFEIDEVIDPEDEIVPENSDETAGGLTWKDRMSRFSDEDYYEEPQGSGVELDFTAHERAAAEARAAQERAAAEARAEEERIAAADRAAKQQAADEQRAAQERAAAEQRAAEQRAAEERAAAELAAQQRAQLLTSASEINKALNDIEYNISTLRKLNKNAYENRRAISDVKATINKTFDKLDKSMDYLSAEQRVRYRSLKSEFNVLK